MTSSFSFSFEKEKVLEAIKEAKEKINDKETKEILEKLFRKIENEEINTKILEERKIEIELEFSENKKEYKDKFNNLVEETKINRKIVEIWFNEAIISKEHQETYMGQNDYRTESQLIPIYGEYKEITVDSYEKEDEMYYEKLESVKIIPETKIVIIKQKIEHYTHEWKNIEEIQNTYETIEKIIIIKKENFNSEERVKETEKIEENTITTIYTHSGKAHLDEFLAISILLNKFNIQKIKRVNKLPEKIEENAIVIDIGEKYDNEKYFDHHQNKELPCSLVLVLKRFFKEIENPEELEIIQWISEWDTKGPTATQKKFNVKLPLFNIDIIGEIILQLFSEKEEITQEDEIYKIMKIIGEKFINSLKKEKEMINKAKYETEVKEIKGLKVVFCKEIILPRIIKSIYKDVAIIVQPNERTPGAYSLIRVDDHPKVDFNRIKVPAHFIHNTGFLAVVDQEYIEQAINEAISE